MVSALRWIDEDSSLELIDQTQLPGETRLLQITTTGRFQ